MINVPFGPAGSDHSSMVRIARQRTVPFDNVVLRVEHDGVTAWGEASPHPYYGASAVDVVRNLESLSGWLRTLSIRSVRDIAKAWTESWTKLHSDRAAQCALDLALWDWLARREGVTVTELAHGHEPRPVTSFATIGLSAKEELDQKIAELEGFPRVKIKSDATADIEPARRVKEELRTAIAIDANGARVVREGLRLIGELREVEMSGNPFGKPASASSARAFAGS